MEDLRERQENEVIVLKSIYSANFLDLREVNNNTNTPNNNVTHKKKSVNSTQDPNAPLMRITLFPLSSQSQHDVTQFYVQIDLKVKLTAEYPNEIPNIKLENEKGLSMDLVKVLYQRLIKKANELKGKEMIYELCQDVQEFLYEQNKPPTKSFYEQRLENKLKMEKQLEESIYEVAKHKYDDQLIAEIDQAVDLKRKMLQMERKKEKELEKRERLYSNNSPSRPFRLSKNDSESDPKESITDLSKSYASKSFQQQQQLLSQFKPFQIDFKEPNAFKINCIKLLGYYSENSLSIYRGIEVNTNEIYDIYEWKICLEKNKIFEKKKLEQCQTEMNKLQEEFKSLNKLNSKLLVKYLAYKYYKETERNIFVVQLCMEYVEGSSIEMFINKKQSYIILDSTLQTFTIQLIDALDYLHTNHVIHRDLKASCVNIERNSLNVKLSGYSLIKKLNNLNDLVTNDAANIITGNTKSDFHQLGLIVLSLCLGEQVKDYHPQVPVTLPPELRNFIVFCLKNSDKVDAKFLRNHPYILKDAQTNVNPYNNAALIKRTTSVHCDDDEDGLKSFTDYSSHSRLNTEFEVIGVVGQGAFGEVLKVKNKLDLRFYAIKRIRINPNSKQYNKQITREIKLLSRLNHENVVRYYSTWVEQDNEDNIRSNERKKSSHSNETYPSINEESDEEEEESSSDGENKHWSRTESDEIDPFNHLSTSNSVEFDSTSSESSTSSSSSSSDSDTGNKFFKSNKKISFNLQDQDDSDDIIFADNSKESLDKIKSQTKAKKENLKKSVDFQEKSIKPVSLKKQYIYIQMEFCGGKTLKDLIEKGLYLSEDKVWCLFREILQGLNHIHEQGMIHRDLKPGNVLIDKNGHAKIGDFGLATFLFKLQKENITAPGINGGMDDIVLEDNMTANSLTYLSNADSHQLDSLSLSGAVGTALYVAPELLTPSTKNKYVYTQKVDIYSLGIMFYEMCFQFATNMERILVIQDLRQKEINISKSLNHQQYEKQICLIRLMLNHDPALRPSAKELLLNEMIPRKADEIALDELLKYSFNNKQSTNYKKILKAIFEQKNSKIEDASFDATNCKPPGSFRTLQIRENVFNQMIRIFQKHGAYMISYPLLTPYSDILDDFNKVFKLTDSSGLVVSLPYNHRIPFARYLARSGCTNIKRYFIGKVFTEKLKLTSLHPREHMEASFDIVTSTPSECMPEIETLSVLSDVLTSFNELQDQTYVLVINHCFLLNAIFMYCGIEENAQKNIYYLLAEYNNRQIKSYDASKENRINWFKDRLPHLNLKDHIIERLLKFLLKTGEPEKILSELRTLTKSESQFSKLAREALHQLKMILTNLCLIDLKIEVNLSPSFVLPVISHPYEYSGFVFQLLIRRKNNKNEYDILASGGRYDNMINKFRNKQTAPQSAVGISFDFDKIVYLIDEKSKQSTFRHELVVCSINESLSTVSSQACLAVNPIQTQTPQNGKLKKPICQKDTPVTSNNALIQQECRNRLRLFKHLMNLNKNLNISTHLIHEKFSSIEDMDEYCKKHYINSYTYIKENSILFTSQILDNYQLNSTLNSASSINLSTNDQLESSLSSTLNNNNNNNSSLASSPSNQSFLKFRSMIERGFRFFEKKINLNDFLSQASDAIRTMTPLGALNSSSSLLPFLNSPFSSNQAQISGTLTSYNSSSSLAQAVTSFNGSAQANSYIDFLSSLKSIGTSMSSASSQHSSSPAISSTSSTLTLTNTSQVNITYLLEPSNKPQTIGNANRRKLESQVISKLNHIFGIFNSKTRIELIVIETPENVIQALANGLHLEMEEQYFSSNWNQCLDKINNHKYKKQLCNFKLEEILHDLRYLKRSKVFILYSLKSEQFKLLVAP